MSACDAKRPEINAACPDCAAGNEPDRAESFNGLEVAWFHDQLYCEASEIREAAIEAAQS